MRKVMKSTLVIMLTLALILTQVSMVTYADNGKGNSNNNGKGNSVTIQNKIQVSEQTRLELREKLRIMVAIGGGDWDGLPEGMVKKGFLPYGLAKRYQNGSFPYGLAKRIKDFQFGQEKPPVDIEVLKALIVTAKAKADGKVAANYEPATSLADFQKAITDAEVVATKTAPTSAEIKTQIEKLKAAILKFENALIVKRVDFLPVLSPILVDLNAYKAKYENNLTVTKLNSLNALILEIGSYLATEPVKIMTVGKLADLVNRAKAFEDPLLALKQYIEKVKGDLYVTPLTNPPVFKNNDSSSDLAVIQYLPGSNAALKLAIETAEVFVATYKDEPVIKITNALTALENAVKVYEGNKILKGEELVILNAFLNELKEYYGKAVANQTPELLSLIKEIEKHFAPTNAYYTESLKAKYFDMAPTYIKGIYDSLRAELVTLIASAEALHAEDVGSEAALIVLKADLKVKIDAAKPISTNTASKFTEINTAYTNLNAAMVAFETPLTVFRNAQLDALILAVKPLIDNATAEQTTSAEYIVLDIKYEAAVLEQAKTNSVLIGLNKAINELDAAKTAYLVKYPPVTP